MAAVLVPWMGQLDDFHARVRPGASPRARWPEIFPPRGGTTTPEPRSPERRAGVLGGPERRRSSAGIEHGRVLVAGSVCLALVQGLVLRAAGLTSATRPAGNT
jgi:hypothetical protein